MKQKITASCLGLLIAGICSCSNNEKSDLNKYIISNLNQDIANKTIYAAREASVDLQTLEHFATKVDSSGNLFTKVNDVNNTVKKISKIIDSHLEWIKDNDEASVESFYSNDNLKEEYEEIKTLMKQLNNDFFQLVNNNTYLTKYPGNENKVKYLHELLSQSYNTEEGDNTLEGFETDIRLLKLNLYLALEKLNDFVLDFLQGDGMLVNSVEGKVFFDITSNKDSVQCQILLYAYNSNIKPIIYVGKVDYSIFKNGDDLTNSGELSKLPIIGKYKKLPMKDSGQFNISMKDFLDKEIEGVIEIPGRNGFIYKPFKRNLITK